MKSNISPDSFFDGLEMWKAELTVLRNIFLSAGLDETMKWGTPTYTYNGKNIVGIAGFKSHFAVWFHNGYFLKDPHGRSEERRVGKECRGSGGRYQVDSTPI